MDSQKPPVGIIGLGIMGGAISGNVLKAGFPVVGYDIDPARIKLLVQGGGQAAASAREVAQRCRFILTSLPSSAALLETVSGKEGLVAAGRKDLIVSECSTLPLEDKQTALTALAGAGCTLLDSPLSGTGNQAVRKDLLVYSSGDKAAYERTLPIYQAFSRAWYHLGEFGNGSRMKFIANLLVSIHNVAAAEALALARKAGLDPVATQKLISDGAGSSRMFDIRGPLMVAGSYDEAFMKLEMWMKDLSIIGKFAAGLNCPTPLFSASSQFYAAAMAQGRGKQDTACVAAILEDLAGVRRS